MFERRSWRFAVEALVLVTLALSVAVAHLNRLLIGAVMLVGWLVVTLVELASLRSQAHYGAGLPPRYYQPEVRLPPPRAIAESVMRRPPAPAPATVEEPSWGLPVEEPAWPVAPVFEPEPVAVAPEPVVIEPEPVAVEPEAVVVKPEPVAAAPELVVVEPEPVAAAPEPVVIEPEPVAIVREVEEPDVAAPADEPVAGDGVELGSPIEFAHAPDGGQHVAELTLGTESALEVWPELPASLFEAPAPDPVPDVVASSDADVELGTPIEFRLAADEIEPVAEAEPEPEPEPIAPAPVMPALQASWFDAPLPGEAQPEPVVEEPVLEQWSEVPAAWLDAPMPVEPAPEPPAPEPVAEAWLPEPELEFPPLPDLPTLPEPELAHWFDAALPGSPAPVEADARADELPAWAFIDLDAEGDDELAAQEFLPEELAPRMGPTSEASPHPDFDVDMPLGEPLPEEANAMSWFDDPGETAWDQEPNASPERHEAPAAGSPFAAGPFTSRDLPQSELELDLLLGRLAGEPLGEEQGLISWFDAQLPGTVAVNEAPAPAEWPLFSPPEPQEVGGWSPSEEASVLPLDEVWGQAAPEDDAGAVEAFRTPEPPDPVARHSIDPLASLDGSSGKLWGRKTAENDVAGSGSVEVPARPVGRPLLPGRAKRDT